MWWRNKYPPSYTSEATNSSSLKKTTTLLYQILNFLTRLDTLKYWDHKENRNAKVKSWNLPLLCKCHSLSHRYQIHHHLQSLCLWCTDAHSFHFLTPQSLKRHNWYIQFTYFFFSLYTQQLRSYHPLILHTKIGRGVNVHPIQTMQVSAWRWETPFKWYTCNLKQN